MDGREGMALQGSPPYYYTRFPEAVQSGQLGSTPVPPGFRPSSNPNNNNISAAQHVVRAAPSSVGLTVAFNVEGGGGGGQQQQAQHGPPPQGFTITVASTRGAMSEPTKKKRGRPRKYGPDGPGSVAASRSGVVALGLSPSTPNSGNLADRKKRGRPPGSGRKQRLSSVGEWMSNSAGAAFMPHVIQVARGEDIAGKILTFAQQRPRALCIMSGSGGVSAVELRQPASSGNVTFEGRFEILCLSGSFLVAETGGSRNRTGGVNVSLSSPDGHVIGGAVGGRLVASRPVQVVVCSFIYGSAKPKSKESDLKEERSSEQPVSDKTSVQIIGSPSQNVDGSWSGSKAVDSKNLNTDIDLASG